LASGWGGNREVGRLKSLQQHGEVALRRLVFSRRRLRACVAAILIAVSNSEKSNGAVMPGKAWLRYFSICKIAANGTCGWSGHSARWVRR